MTRLAIATNQPIQASWFLMKCAPEDLPAWCSIYSTFDSIGRIPDGCKVFSYWKERVAWKSAELIAFEIRKSRGGFTYGLSADDFEKIDAWAARRDADQAAFLALAAAELEAKASANVSAEVAPSPVSPSSIHKTEGVERWV